jgi:hypothetical protein
MNDIMSGGAHLDLEGQRLTVTVDTEVFDELHHIAELRVKIEELTAWQNEVEAELNTYIQACESGSTVAPCHHEWKSNAS